MSVAPAEHYWHGVITRVRKLNLCCWFLASKVAFSWPSVDRFGKNFGRLMTLGQVKISPNFCSFGPQRAEKRNIWRRNHKLKFNFRTLLMMHNDNNFPILCERSPFRVQCYSLSEVDKLNAYLPQYNSWEHELALWNLLLKFEYSGARL